MGCYAKRPLVVTFIGRDCFVIASDARLWFLFSAWASLVAGLALCLEKG